MFALQFSGWFEYDITAREVHPTEDIGLVKLDDTPLNTLFRLSNSVEHASCTYRLWGYPDYATFELLAGNQAMVRPDLVYNEVYVRRRSTDTLPAIQGTSFFELSEVAGTGASGAPVCKVTASVWDVIGIYVGEEIDDDWATSVSYAVREESFRGWVPKISGKSVHEESQSVII